MMEPTPEQVEMIESEIRACRAIGRPMFVAALAALLASWRGRGEQLGQIRKTLRHPESEEHYATLLRINQWWRDAAARKLWNEHRTCQRLRKQLEEAREKIDDYKSRYEALLDGQQAMLDEFNEKHKIIQTLQVENASTEEERDSAREKLAKVVEALEMIEDGLKWSDTANWTLAVARARAKDRVRVALAAAKG